MTLGCNSLSPCTSLKEFLRTITLRVWDIIETVDIGNIYSDYFSRLLPRKILVSFQQGNQKLILGTLEDLRTPCYLEPATSPSSTKPVYEYEF